MATLSPLTASEFNSFEFCEQDDALRRKAVGVLKSCGYTPLGRLDCRVEAGIVGLAGEVPTYFLKQMAQTLVLRVESVKGIRNEIQVV